MIPEKEEIKLNEDTIVQNTNITETKLIQSDKYTADSSIT